MSKIKLIIASMIIVLSSSVWAGTSTWTDGGIIWVYSFVSRTKTVYLGGEDNDFAIGKDMYGVLTIPSSGVLTIPLKVGGNGQYPVVGIGGWAFCYCEELTLVTLHPGVTFIGEGAFCGCSSIASMDIPENVTDIGDYAFADCSNLNSISIPSTIESIGEGVFADSGKDGQLTVYVKSGHMERVKALIDASSVDNYYTYPAITYRDAGVPTEYIIRFDANGGDCDTEAIVRGENDTLGELPVPSRTDFRFVGWFTSQNGGTQIYDDTTVRDDVTYYAHWTPSAQTVNGLVWSWEIVNGEARVFGVLTTDANPVEGNVTIPSSITIPSLSETYTVTSLGPVFANITGLLSVSIPDTVRIVGDNAFSGCTGLKNVEIPDSVTTIGARAFYNCSHLQSILIPSSVNEIGSGAFSGTVLSTVYVELSDGKRVHSLVEGSGYPESVFRCVELGGTVSLTLHANGGTIQLDGGDPVTVVDNVAVTVAGSSYIGSVPTPTLDNYNFVGWFTAAEGGKELTAYTMLDDGINDYYAHWEAKPLPDFAILAGRLWKVNSLNGNVDIEIPDTVTVIGLEAFTGCKGMKSVTIPSSVREIENDAFASCTDLKSVTMSDSVTTMWTSVFSGCTALTDIRLSAGLSKIPLSTFKGCTALTTLPFIPSGIRTIEGEAFYGCTSLESADIPGTVRSIEGHAFAECRNLANVTIANGMEIIGNYAFEGCTALEGITIPDSVTGMGRGVFTGCTSLLEIDFGSGIQEIMPFMCHNCSALERVVFGDKLIGIGESAFWCCANLCDIAFPKSLKDIQKNAFWGCSSLVSVELPKCEVGSLAFFGCTSLKSFTIDGAEQLLPKLLASSRRLLGASDDSSKIGSLALYRCTELESVTLGKSVDSIGGGAFSGCPKLRNINIDPENDNFTTVDGMLLTRDGKTLVSGVGAVTDVTVPSGVKNILDGAFADYTTLTNVTLAGSVTTVGEAAFSNCTAFATMTAPASVASIGANAFYGAALGTVYVTAGDSLHISGLIGGTGYDASGINFVEMPAPASEWPEEPSAVKGKTAAEAFGIIGELAAAKADDLATWAKENSVEFGDTSSIIPNAFLLNCANTAETVAAAEEAAKEAIKITEITFDDDGNPVLEYSDDDIGNGEVVLQGSTGIGESDSWHDGKQTGDLFFRTVLRFK